MPTVWIRASLKVAADEVMRLISLSGENAGMIVDLIQTNQHPQIMSWLAVFCCMSFALRTEAAKVDFDRDIRPIMADT